MATRQSKLFNKHKLFEKHTFILLLGILMVVAIGGLIDRLEKSGLLRREADASDRRVNRVFLEPQSKQLISKMRKVTHEMNEIILDNIPVPDLEASTKTLEAMKRNLLDYLNSTEP